MNLTFIIGLLGSLILVLGAAWPEPKHPKHPVQSLKNWLFAVGGVVMMIYAILGYLQGSSIFFVFMQLLIFVSTVLMMLHVDDRIDSVILGISAAIIIIWSLYLFQGYTTIIFILGLLGISLGYAFDMGTFRRDLALTIGSLLIAFFSYVEANWIFFWLNLFFAIFSGFYFLKRIGKGKNNQTTHLRATSKSKNL